VDLVTTGTLRPTIMSAPTAAVGAQTDMARTWRIDVIDPKRNHRKMSELGNGYRLWWWLLLATKRASAEAVNLGC
jgi:hypothetical protein